MNITFYHKLKKQLENTPQKADLVAVTKYSDVTQINEAIKMGITKIGENRVEIMEQKFTSLLPVEKHFIGRIQSKKIKKIVHYFDVIQSVSKFKYLEKIEKQAQEQQKNLEVFLQINISGESQKDGFLKEELDQIKNIMPNLKNTKITGIMGMAENTSDQAKIRKQFHQAKVIFEKLKTDILNLKHISIGMSSDYELALAEGATLVRIGSKLFLES